MPLLLMLAWPLPANAASWEPQRPTAARVNAAVRLMADLQDESRRHARRMRQVYRREANALALRDRRALAAALDTGALALLQPEAAPGFVQPRLTGRHPIGEMDLAHQHLYVSARPEALGCLFEIAARVSGPLELTSLARHEAYQRSLARRNANARTDVPTHAMGLAFDISILHVPLATAIEIRDVLRGMAAAGDLYFIAEQRQLVFHVVPAPAKRAYYAALFAAASGIPRPVLPSPEPPPLPDPRESLPPPVLAASVLPFDLELASEMSYAVYGLLFAWVASSGLGVPPGEDLIVAGAGALVGQGVFAWWPVMLLAIAAVLVSDAFLFWCGRSARSAAAKRPALVPGWLLQRMDRLVSRCGGAAVAIARFIPGTRGLVYFAAGARGMRGSRFLAIDACAAIVWVAALMALGIWLATLASGDPSAAVSATS